MAPEALISCSIGPRCGLLGLGSSVYFARNKHIELITFGRRTPGRFLVDPMEPFALLCGAAARRSGSARLGGSAARRGATWRGAAAPQ